MQAESVLADADDAEEPIQSRLVADELVQFAREQSDKELITLLPTLNDAALQTIYDDLRPEECSCRLVPLPCDCGEATGEYCATCDMEPDFVPCRHYKRYYASWPVLVHLCDLVHPDPPAPTKRDCAMEQEERVTVLEERDTAGLGLWNPNDLIHESVTSVVNDRIRRFFYTLAGWKKQGRPDVVKAPPANGDMIAGRIGMQFVEPPKEIAA